VTYGNPHRQHHRPDKAHGCSVKLAQQRANGEAGIYVAIPDPDADLGFSFVPMHPDWTPDHITREADVRRQTTECLRFRELGAGSFFANAEDSDVYVRPAYSVRAMPEDATARPSTYDVGVTIPAPRIGTRSYYSTHFLAAAQDVANRADTTEQRLRDSGESRFSIELRGYVLSAVIHSTAFMEATIGEALQDAYDDHYTPKIDKVDATTLDNWKALWTALDGGSSGSALPYFRAAMLAAGLPAPDEGTQPWQDAKLLVRLRNHLIHYRPETAFADDPQRLVVNLSNRLQPSPTTANEGGVGRFLSAECAHWSVESATSLVEYFAEHTGVIPNYLQTLEDLRRKNP